MFNPCSKCDARCCRTYTISVTAFDILRISKATNKKLDEYATLHEVRLLEYDPDMVLQTKDGYGYYLLGLKSHPCVFIGDDNKCAVYASAPISCRSYPFQISGRFNPRLCPVIPSVFFRLKGIQVDKEILLSELEFHKDFVSEWNKKPGRKKECIPFLVERARETEPKI